MDDYDEMFGLGGIECIDAKLDKMVHLLISGFKLWPPEIVVKLIAQKTDDEWANEMIQTLDLGEHMRVTGYEQPDLADAVARYRAKLAAGDDDVSKA